MSYRLFFALLLFLYSCKNSPSDDFLRAALPAQAAPKPGTTFEQIPASRSGINFTPQLQENFQYNFLLDPYEYNGGGVAVLDVDNDGLQDLFFTHRFNGCRLYRNKGNFEFEDISESSGVAQFDGLKTGVAVVDINGDGWQDIYVCRTWLTEVPERRNLLFINSGPSPEGLDEKGPDGKGLGGKEQDSKEQNKAAKNSPPSPSGLGKIAFTEQAAAYGIDDPSPSQCANFFDYDLDGDLDLYVVNHPIDFRNMNNIDYQPSPAAPRASSQTPKYTQESDRLYRNNGKGKFEDVSQQAGIHNRAYGLSATTADFNDDGWPDLLVANDFVMPDFLYINNRKGGFSEEAHRWFDHTANHAMGCDINDLNNDAYPDICIPDMLGSTPQRQKELMSTMILERTEALERQGYGRQQMRNVLQVFNPGPNPNPSPPGEGGMPSSRLPYSRGDTPLPWGGGVGGGAYAELGCLAQIQATEWSWAPLIADFDNDGWKDLFITSGVYRDLNDLDFFFYTADSLKKTGGITEGRFENFEAFAGKMSSYPVRNFMFQNSGSLQLSEVSEAWGLGQKGFSNGAAYADLDNDGDLDLIINNLNEPATIYKNQATSTTENHWLQIICKGKALNSSGIGAKIWVHAGEQVFYQEMTPIRGFYSSVEPIFQVGLGKLKTVDRVSIEWPGGQVQVLEQVAANQRLTLNFADTQPGQIQRPGSPPPLFVPMTKAQTPAFVHQENEFEDFNRERLLLHRFSRSGPCLATGDLNSDGLDDLFVGGAGGQSGAIFLQQSDGRFSTTPQPALDGDKRHEDTGATFFDADGDGDLDLYVVSGSNEEAAGADYYQDRLYINDGQGRFSRQADAIPKEGDSGATVRAHDFDGDGDLDLFVGSRVKPGLFPETPRSLLLVNDGKGKFSLAAPEIAGDFGKAGMVTDLQFADLDGDRRAELIICGEWMPIRVFQFDGKTFVDAGAKFGLGNTGGFWNCLAIQDLDGDGDLDFVAGNEGLNTRLKARPGAPLRLFALDFDLNQSLDPVVAIAHEGKYYPLAQRNELAAQMPNLIKPKFIRYRQYARALLEEVLDVKKLRAAQKLEVQYLESCWFENKNGQFVPHPLPLEAQISCTKRIVLHDFTNDGRPDLLLFGNDSNNNPETGPYDASKGILLAGDGKGNWRYIPNAQHGLWANGEVRAAELLRTASGKKALVIGFNKGHVRAWNLENARLEK